MPNLKSFKDYLLDSDAGFAEADGRLVVVEEAFRLQDTINVLDKICAIIKKETGLTYAPSTVPNLYKDKDGSQLCYYAFGDNTALRFNTVRVKPKTIPGDKHSGASKEAFNIGSLDICTTGSTPEVRIVLHNLNIVDAIRTIKDAFNDPKKWVGRRQMVQQKAAVPPKDFVVVIEESYSGMVEEAAVTANGETYASVGDAVLKLIEAGHNKETMQKFTNEEGTRIFSDKQINIGINRYKKNGPSAEGKAGSAPTAASPAAQAKAISLPKIPDKIPVDELFSDLTDLVQFVVGSGDGATKIPKTIWDKITKDNSAVGDSGRILKPGEESKDYRPGGLKVLLVAGMAGVGKCLVGSTKVSVIVDGKEA